MDPWILACPTALNVPGIQLGMGDHRVELFIKRRRMQMEIIENALQNGETMLSEYDAKKLLATYGVPVTREILVKDENSLDEALETIGYPLAMKACSTSVAHKTEKNLLRLNLNQESEARQAYEDLVKAMNGDGGGVLVQEMIKGSRELMVGMTRDLQFGPTVMFGIGGIFAEVFKDAAFRLAPLEKKDAFEMMDGINGHEILGAIRGMDAADRDLLADILVQVGRIGLEYPTISEIDINPLILNGSTPVAVDALVVLDTEKVKG